jgi:CheY-like chemotaxis protein
MTKEQKQHLFEPFYTTKGPERGTGLGLASVYGAVQGHGGTISVQSEVGKGTTVTIMLPVADEAAPAQEAKATAQAMAQKAARIMVVDDEAPILDVVKEVLENAGYQAETFSSAPEAVDHFLKEPDAVDLVLLDMMMPRMSGLEVFRAMKAARPSVRAILITGYSVDEKAQELMAEGVRGYLHKPFKRAELIEKIREVLGEGAKDGDQ